MEMELKTYVRVLSEQRRAASHVRSANPFTQLSDGGCTCRHRYTPFPPLHTPSLPCNKHFSSTHPVWQGDSHKLRVGPLLTRLMKIFTHTHTHTCEWVHVSALIAGIWKFHHLFDQLLPFSYRERDRRKRYKRVVPNYFICHTHCHCQRDCNLAKIMLANKNGKRHKRPSSPLTPPSLYFSFFIYLYISIFLPVAPAAHFKLIVAIYSVFYMPEETHMLCILYRYTCIHPDVVYSYIAHSHARD